MQRPKDGFTRTGYAVWVAVRKASTPAFRFLWDLDVSGDYPDAPFVLGANHLSVLDPVIIGKVIGPVRYLAVDEIYGRVGWFDKLITGFGAIPLTRTKVALNALRTADDYLAKGGVVGVFPEGRLVWNWGDATPKRGAAWLALRRQVPLVPLAIWGTQDSLGKEAKRIRRYPVRVEIGPPLRPEDYPGHPLEASHKMIADWESWMDDAMGRLRRRAREERA